MTSYKCPTCGRSFQQLNGYYNHATDLKHRFDWPIICDVCKHPMKDAQALQQHRDQKHAGVAAKAAAVTAVTTSLGTASSNGGSASTSSDYRCAECLLDFDSQTTLEGHYKTSDNHPTCPRCHRGKRDSVVLNIHMQLHHRVIRCILCDDTIYEDEKQRHYDISHPRCTECGAISEDKHHLIEHRNSRHPSPDLKPAMFRCAPCNRADMTEIAFHKHYKDPKAAYPICAICEIGFVDNDTCDEHMMKKHAPKAHMSSSSQSVRKDAELAPISSQMSSSSSPVFIPEVVSLPSTLEPNIVAAYDQHIQPCVSDTNQVVSHDAILAADSKAYVQAMSELSSHSAPNSVLSSPAVFDRTLDCISVPEPTRGRTGGVAQSSVLFDSSPSSVTPVTKPISDSSPSRPSIVPTVSADAEDTTRTTSPESFATPDSQASALPDPALLAPGAIEMGPVVPPDITAMPQIGRAKNPIVSRTQAPDGFTSEPPPQYNGTGSGSVRSAWGPRTDDQQAAQAHIAPKSPGKSMWYCRVCLQDPCHEPTATVCGHFFCHGCIMRELSTHHQCPVCKKAILVRLHVEDS
ncbi:hypothetical protein OBBRIDRAFT_796498 [Obba rivulosa]|uniref:RING-type domain-containing protein n=1 Tax=Obba rivulosa TaxID=1052685 RepID=A0A8E2DHM4_9APHY|nr:hypothetical protein OBBRIDRAFT_796498 [Obba rivulosa]